MCACVCARAFVCLCVCLCVYRFKTRGTQEHPLATSIKLHSVRRHRHLCGLFGSTNQSITKVGGAKSMSVSQPCPSPLPLLGARPACTCIDRPPWIHGCNGWIDVAILWTCYTPKLDRSQKRGQPNEPLVDINSHRFLLSRCKWIPVTPVSRVHFYLRVQVLT